MEQTKIWDYFQNAEEVSDVAFNARSRYEFIARQVMPGMSVLNIGVGRGGLERTLLEQKAVVSSLDPSEDSVARLQAQYALGDRAKVGFSQAIPFSDSEFDVVVMSEVLEHLDNEVLSATLVEVKRVLKKGGRFIGTVPAEEQLIENRVMCPHCGEPFHRWGHVQSFDERRLSAMLSQEFVDVRVSRHFFADVQTLNWKGRIGLALKRSLLALGVKGSGETFFFVAKTR